MEYCEEKPRVCSICYLIFQSEDLLQIHGQQCSAEGLQAEMQTRLEILLREEKPHVCGKCFHKFASKDLLKDHSVTCTHKLAHRSVQMEAENNEIQLDNCPTCGEAFLPADLLMNHILTCYEKKPVACEENHPATEENDMAEHKLEHLKINPAVTNVSQHEVKQEQGDEEADHEKDSVSRIENDEMSLMASVPMSEPQATVDKPYPCDQCEKAFSNKGYLWKHKLMHTGKKPHKCDQCGKCFARKTGLNGHLRRHMTNKPYQCKMCEKTFCFNNELRKHLYVHTGNTLYKCDYCDKGFNRKSYLTAHVRKHTGEKPYQCDQCEERFSGNGYLQKHIRSHHGGEKPYQCDQCEKRFSDKRYLQFHIRIHNGEVYRCDQCHKSFTSKSNLMTHRVKICGNERYKCNQCERSFPQEKSLVKHIEKLHTGGNSFRCLYCKKSFCRMQFLKSHYQKHKILHQNLTTTDPMQAGKRDLDAEHTDEKSHPCGSCHLAFESEESYKKHKLICSGGKPGVLSIADSSTALADDTMKQALENGPIELNVCSTCNEVFLTEDSRRNHCCKVINISVAEILQNPIKKEICENKLKSSDGKNEDITGQREGNQHGARKPLDKVMIQNHAISQLDYDISKLRDGATKPAEKPLQVGSSYYEGDDYFGGNKEDKPHKCDQCDRSFRFKATLIQHAVVHIRYPDGCCKCEQCGKSFPTKSKLTNHVKRHLTNRPHKCDQCNASFIYNANLIVHYRTHTGEKPFKCDQCGKGFIDKWQVKKHKLIHTGEKPHQCEKCGMAFVYKERLMEHYRRTHTDYTDRRTQTDYTQSYSCDQCDKGFSYKSHLEIHYRIHSGEKPFRCDTCDLAFKSKSDLNKHSRTQRHLSKVNSK